MITDKRSFEFGSVVSTSFKGSVTQVLLVTGANITVSERDFIDVKQYENWQNDLLKRIEKAGHIIV